MSKIEWTDKTWNPVTGCTKISEGCLNCYAISFSKRLSANPKTASKYRNADKVTVHPDELDKPFKWKKPKMIFVCSMGDLFHVDVPWMFIHKVIETIRQNPQHTFILLTKRADKMAYFYASFIQSGLIWPNNIWCGITAENQQRFDERMPYLKRMPGVKFISVEPMLSEVDISRYARHINWVICGGETGHHIRRINSDWAVKLLNQTRTHNIPFFFKSWGFIKLDMLMGCSYHEFPIVE